MICEQVDPCRVLLARAADVSHPSIEPCMLAIAVASCYRARFSSLHRDIVQVSHSAPSLLQLVFRANVRILQLSDIRVHIGADLQT